VRNHSNNNNNIINNNNSNINNNNNIKNGSIDGEGVVQSTAVSLT